MLARELITEDEQLAACRVQKFSLGLDNCVYVIFHDHYHSEWYFETFMEECDHIACFGGYQNSVCVQMLWGQ